MTSRIQCMRRCQSIYVYNPWCVRGVCILYSRQGDELAFHHLADETLDELTDFFDDLGERDSTHSDFDASFSVRLPCIYVPSLLSLFLSLSLSLSLQSGVLTVGLGGELNSGM